MKVFNPFYDDQPPDKPERLPPRVPEREPEVVPPLPLPRLPGQPEELYSVPRRFDIATLLTVSFAYSLLFTLLRLLDSPWYVFAFIGGMTVVVGAAQALFSDRAGPRWPSTIAGVVYCVVWAMVAGGMIRRLDDSICLVVSALLFGSPLGYVCGVVEAGVFLVADKVRQRWFPEAPPHEPEDSASLWDRDETAPDDFAD